MVKRKIYKALSVAMASSMLMATPSPALVNAEELPKDATEEVVEELKEESKEDAKEDSKEDSKEEVKEESKEEAKEESKEEVKEETKEEKKEDSKGESEEKTKEDSEEKDSKEKEKKDLEDDEESKKTCEITYSMFDFDDSYEGGSWGSTVTKSKGGVKIEYSGNYAEKVFGLPKGIKGTDVVSVKANLLKGSKSGFSLKFRNKGEEVKAAYGTDVIENTDKAEFDGIGLMNSSGGETSFTIQSITLTLKGDAEDYPTPSEIKDDNTKPEIQWDIPDLRDYISCDEGLGKDSYTGAAIMISEITDEALMDIVEKHFNAVTFGNEFKPDSLMNYNNAKPADGQIITETWTDAKGVTHKDMAVPKLDFTRPEKMLRVIKDWNDEHPDKEIKIRGHVLTWHSQTPEWFFKENYDPNGDWVSPEEMTLRHEWYIKSVFEHVFSSEYKDMFYGWDVVNEACSDSTGTYRSASASERSNWARIYGTGSKEDAPDYILNAFRFANYYAHKMGKDDVELYYNDYNECSGNKPDAIAQLLESVKRHEGDAVLPTRISGFGMQGHHNMLGPSKQKIVDCGKRYGKIVGKIQVTELDFKCSDEYDGTSATEAAEYTREAYRYKEIFEAYKEIDADPDIDVNGFTVWGVIDPNSWLQTSNSAGGGANGNRKQVPLLFDGDYMAKPAYWAFVDPSKLEPAIKSINVIQAAAGENAFAHGKAATIEGTDYTFIPVWDNGKLLVKVKANGATSAKLYVDFAASMEDGAEVSTAEATMDENGECVLEIETDATLAAATRLALDVVVTDAEGEHAFNNLRLTQDEGSKYYAKGTCKPYANVAKGTVTVDGDVDKAWEVAKDVVLSVPGSNPKATASAKLLWDEENLYVLMNVKDANLDASASAVHEKDSVEVFIDENNNKSEAYEDDDKQYRINYLNETSFNGTKCIEDNVKHAVKLTDDGYMVEAAFAWTDITPEVGTAIGLDLQINDGEGGARIGTRSWYDETGNGWSAPKVFGEVTLADKDAEDPELPDDPTEPEEPEIIVPSVAEVADVVYTGAKLTPEVVVTAGDKVLAKDVDYTVSYKNNKNAAAKVGSGMGEEFDASLPTVEVKFIGEYADNDAVKANFTIAPVDFADEDAIEVEPVDTFVESIFATRPGVTVRFNGKNLSKTNYTLQYRLGEDGKLLNKLPSHASNADGTYYAVVTAKGKNFVGSTSVELDILEDVSIHVLEARVWRTADYNRRTGAVKVKASYTVKTNSEAKFFGTKKGDTVVLESGKDFDASIVVRERFTGLALVKLSGNGAFYGDRVVILKLN
ncbi:endo-1,4-beta-xylanase [Pseudobutyrivibrio sp.]|uniref:endo-1,4-beta-xylanase n=1 Tax=Pseudobutyrivibrio sp. TaxID=2014367 RepID=UPI001B789604|nr:endo-1,4-beta-xylanase [Pseudobutyrivibrio sp.]MBP3261444.1 endo-1,4-beta-xylanase [Pseudobutyrivibrio sp.]